jgi:hypothetical protein
MAIFLHKTYADFYNLSKELIAHIAHTEIGYVLDETNGTLPNPNQDDADIVLITWLMILLMNLMKINGKQQ